MNMKKLLFLLMLPMTMQAQTLQECQEAAEHNYPLIRQYPTDGGEHRERVAASDFCISTGNAAKRCCVMARADAVGISADGIEHERSQERPVQNRH